MKGTNANTQEIGRSQTLGLPWRLSCKQERIHPANAGDTALASDPGKYYMPRGPAKPVRHNYGG